MDQKTKKTTIYLSIINMLFSFISITILFSNIEYSISETNCKQKSMILFRGHYSNIIVLNKSLISTRKTNTISGSN